MSRSSRGHRRWSDQPPRGWCTAGGVVVDPVSGRVAVVRIRREHRQGNSGWTWPKGRIDCEEDPLRAAIREVHEESGVLAAPVAAIALLRTRRALRHYFLLTKLRDDDAHGHETLLVRWVTLGKAKRLLDRRRDRVVLKAARRTLAAIRRVATSELGTRPSCGPSPPLLSLVETAASDARAA
ncbi:MAG: NUDIX hydrolase [Deltaproteobacteria bacterium]|nr:NUDIX hydrolase [Deltaproteobacteria bacterium]